MRQGRLTDEEVKILRKNPFIKSISCERIRYTKEFKIHFMREYLAGKGPTRIFREAGFDTELLGAKRIERAAAHWREAYHAGRLDAALEAKCPNETLLEQLKTLQEENKLLKEKIQQLRL